MFRIEKDKTLTKGILDLWFLIALMFGTILFVFIVTTRLSHASEIETLCNKLVEKGILTSAEAQAIVVETREEERKKIAQVKEDILPEWIQKTRLYGDFRLREAYEDTTGKDERWRTRLRLRLNAEFTVNDQFKVGAGLASGTWTGQAGVVSGASKMEFDNSRSNNETLNGVFSKSPITLNTAYFKYTPTNWLTAWGGKFYNPIWTVSGDDLVWDPDITPEGLAAQFNKNLSDQFGLFTNIGFFILDEFNDSKGPYSTSGQDPYMFVFQPGFEWKIKNAEYADIANIKAALAYYSYNHVKGEHFVNASVKSYGVAPYPATNTVDANGNFVYNYDAFQPTIQAGYMPQGLSIPYINLPISYIGAFGQFVYNPDPKKENKGWQAGGIVGAEKVVEKGQWQAKFLYRVIQRDAILDVLPDDDFFSGYTNVRGWKEQLTYGIYKNVNISLTGYQTGTLRAIPKTGSVQKAVAGNLLNRTFFLDLNLAF
jgi:hypothetical protein